MKVKIMRCKFTQDQKMQNLLLTQALRILQCVCVCVVFSLVDRILM
jgi:hypothetical protein